VREVKSTTGLMTVEPETAGTGVSMMLIKG